MRSTKQLLVVALLVITACTSGQTRPSVPPHSRSSEVATTSTRLVSLAKRATVQVPNRWFESAFKGVPAPTYLPILFLGTRPFTGRCVATAPAAETCNTRTWFPPGSTVAAGELLLMWVYVEQPSSPRDSKAVSGDINTRFGQRPATLSSGRATRSCPPGTDSEIDARVFAYALTHPGERLDLRACLGPKVSAADRQAVDAMLASLQVVPAPSNNGSR